MQLRERVWQQLTDNYQAPRLFSDALELYLSSRASIRTIIDKKNKLAWWQTQLKNSLIEDVTTDRVLSCLLKKSDVGIATKNRYISEIKAFLNFCHQELGWIEKVPFLRTAKEPKRSFMKLDKREIKSLIDAAPRFMKPIILFALLTGLRQGNILGLRWAHVNFKNETISIEASEHKSKDHVVTPLSADALALLKELQIASVSSYVFVNSAGNAMKELSHGTWKRIIRKANLDGLRFHDLRHNWATNHVEAGTDLLALKELGGWKTLDMVQRYAHPSPNYLLAQANNINSVKSSAKEHLLPIENEELCKSLTQTKSSTDSPDSEYKLDEKRTDSFKAEKVPNYKKSSQVPLFGTNDSTLLVKGEALIAKNLLYISRLSVVPEAGLEPAQYYYRRILNPLRLPISPLWH